LPLLIGYLLAKSREPWSL